MKRRAPSALWGDYAAQLAHFTKPLENGCWEFTGYVLPSGYGQLGRNVGAHRIAWEVANGRPIPAGLVIDHTCHNADLDCHADTECPHRRCVNPAHLEAVSSATNILRGHSAAAINARRQVCSAGHPFTANNIYERPDAKYPNRNCRACKREREGGDNSVVRSWLLANGYDVGARGPIAESHRAAYVGAVSA
jgi:hypothetical protein